MSIIETSLYAPAADNPNKLVYIGQKTVQKVFDELKCHLETEGYLPDEYFLLDSRFKNGELFPDEADVICYVNWGANEGIYINISLRFRNEKGDLQYQGFATGKTLGESDADLDRMYVVAAACTKAFHSPGVHSRFIIAKEEKNGTNDSNSFEFLFDALALESKFCPAVHIKWVNIINSASGLLSGVLYRDIRAEVERSDYYNWSINVSASPVTEEEVGKLNEIFGADEYDREIQENDDYPAKEICQGLATKIISKLVPFPVTKSFADDDGVWLVGEATDAVTLKENTKNNSQKENKDV